MWPDQFNYLFHGSSRLLLGEKFNTWAWICIKSNSHMAVWRTASRVPRPYHTRKRPLHLLPGSLWSSNAALPLLVLIKP